MSEEKKIKDRSSPVRHRVAWIAGAVVAVVVVGFATYYLSTITVSSLEVHGAIHAQTEDVIKMSGVSVGDTLYRLDPDLLAGRVALHPWVETLEVTRWPSGALTFDVLERTPVALSVSASGKPVYYLDQTGEQLPVDSYSLYDVPLIRGVANGTRPVSVRDSTTLELLGVLASLPPSVDGLLSDLIVRPDGEVDAITVPVHDGRCIRVRLGRGAFERKMRTLRAFWAQAVAGHPKKRIEWIDLRFRGQVVTKEESYIS